MYNCMIRLHPIYVLIHLFKGKAIPVQAYYRPRGFQELEAPIFRDSWQMMLVRLSANTPAAFNPQEIFLVFISVRG